MKSVMRFYGQTGQNFGLTCTDAGKCLEFIKSPAIHLGLPGRDEAIERFNDFNRVLAKAGIHIGYMTWEPNKVLTSKWAVGEYTRRGSCKDRRY